MSLLTLLVGISVSAQQISAFLPTNTLIGVTYIGKVAHENGRLVPSAHRQVTYNPSMGSVTAVAQGLVDESAKSFAPLDGIDQYAFLVDVIAVQGNNVLTGIAEYETPVFKLESGKIPSEFLSVKLQWGSYVDLYRPGLKGVELSVTNAAGQQVIHEVTENGVSDTTCTLFPGNGAYKGPDFLELYGWVCLAEVRDPSYAASGTLTEYYSLDHKSKKVIDIATGATLVDTTAPMISLSLFPASSEEITNAQKASKLSLGTTRAIKLSVASRPGKVTIEYCEVLGGPWKALTVLTNAYGSVDSFDGADRGQRFYRGQMQ